MAARGENGAKTQTGLGEGLTERRRRSGRACSAAGLEHGDDLSLCSLAGGDDRDDHLGGVMRVVVNDGVTLNLAGDLVPAPDTVE